MGQTVLVAISGDEIRHRVRAEIDRLGYEVFEAASTARAVSLAENLESPITLAEVGLFKNGSTALIEAFIHGSGELIVLADPQNPGPALTAVSLGAGDILDPDPGPDQLAEALGMARDRLAVRAKIERLGDRHRQTISLAHPPAYAAELDERLHLARLNVARQMVKGVFAAFTKIVGEVQGKSDFFPNIPTYVSIHNADRKVIETNVLLKERFGDKVGQASWELCSLTAPDPEDCPVNRSFETGRKQFDSGLIQDLEGERVPVMIATLPIHDLRGEVVLVIGIAADMTDAQRLREELASAREFHSRLFDEVPCYISVQDRELNLTAFNRRFKEHFGGEVGQACHQVIEGRERPCSDCPVIRTFETGQPQSAEKEVTALDGHRYRVLSKTAPLRNESGEVTQVMEMATDITEVTDLQRELVRTRQLYQQLFDEVPCYISVQDRNFVLTAANRRFKEDFGDHIGARCHEIYKHRPTPCNVCPVAMTFADGQPHSTEEVVTSLDGRQINTLTWTAPLRDESGEIVQVMEMSTDITEIRRMQDHLTNLGLLIGSISHGVKGLLTGLDGGMYLMSTGFQKGDESRIGDGWKTVRLMVDRIKSTVLDILYYAKERDLNWEKTAVGPLVERVASAVAPKAKAQGVGFIKEFDENLGEFEVDAQVVSSALVNFLENAVDACVGDKADKDYEISFRVARENGNILFRIEDNGMGMDEETKNNMFTLFFSSKGSSGTGLGMYIAHDVIEQHGGSIVVESELGGGTRFRILIPTELPEEVKG